MGERPGVSRPSPTTLGRLTPGRSPIRHAPCSHLTRPISSRSNSCGFMPSRPTTTAPSPTTASWTRPPLPRCERCEKSGRKLVLVTGRELPDLLTRLSQHRPVRPGGGGERRDRLRPGDARKRACSAEPPPKKFVGRTEGAAGVGPISVGHVIVATWEPHQETVLEVIHELGLELQVIFNKGAVMILPSGVNKATGLAAALAELGLSPHNAVGVGDAENDHAFLARVRVLRGRGQRPARGQGHRRLVTARRPRRRRRGTHRRDDRRRPH